MNDNDDYMRDPIEGQLGVQMDSKRDLLSMFEIQFTGYYNTYRLIIVNDPDYDQSEAVVEFVDFYNKNTYEINNSLLILTALATVFVDNIDTIGEYNKVCYNIRKILCN